MLKDKFSSVTAKWNSLYPFYQFLLAGVGYVFVFAIIYPAEYSLGLIKVLPDRNNLLVWDGGWYNSIRTSGYSYPDKGGSNTGFFPLMPYLWRWMQLGNVGICIFMLVVSLVSIAWLSSFLKSNWTSFFVAISFPTMFYMFLPYTEALFFLFSVMAIIGWSKKNYLLLFTGLFLASLTRVSAIFLVMAFIGAEILDTRNSSEVKERLKRIIAMILVVAGGILLVLIIQYNQTHVWGAYFKSQAESWDRKFKWPTFPMGSPAGKEVLWIQILGLWVGIACLIVLLRTLYYRVKKKTPVNPLFLASVIYLLLTVLSEVFFNPTWWSNYSGFGTWMVGLARYIFVNAFFFIFVYQVFNVARIKYTKVGLFLFFCIALSTHLFVTDLTMRTAHTWNRYIIFMILGLLFYFLAYTFPKTRIIIAIIIIQLVLQVYYAGNLLNGLRM